MSQPTQQTYKRSLAGSVGAGLSSVFNAGGRTYYILEHKVSSKYHRAGEAQEIIVDQIEIGRDPKCQVQFDENFTTVSRRHAAIVRDADNWKLVQLSQTNQTFLNGRPVTNEWYLQNGDEIQLSINGPKLGFIVPTGNKAKTGSIALSRRLSLFRQQALKPYKTAMAVMAMLLVLAIGGGVWYAIHANQKIVEITNCTNEQLEEARTNAAVMQARLDSANSKIIALDKKYKNLKNQIKEVASPKSDVTGSTRVSGSKTSNKTIAACEPSVYFVLIRKIVIKFEGETKTYENVGTGSGFLLNDGRFVTARHVVEPWMFPTDASDEFNILCNAVAHNGGEVISYIDAYSPTGQTISFTSKQVRVNRTADESITFDGITLRKAPLGPTDYAYYSTSQTKGLAYHNQLSKQLEMRDKLTILGYPMGLGANSPTDIRPIYSEAAVACDGLERGLILTTATTFEHGNSGGPVFATTTDGELIVVGLVSAGAGRSTGFVVPISAVK